jgi:hypothetical protein
VHRFNSSPATTVALRSWLLNTLWVMLGWSIVCSETPVCGQSAQSDARQQVLQIVGRHHGSSMTLATSSASLDEWNGICQSLLSLVAAHHNVDHDQLMLVRQQLALLKTRGARYSELYQAVSTWSDSLASETTNSLIQAARQEAQHFQVIEIAQVARRQSDLRQQMLQFQRSNPLNTRWREFLQWDQTLLVAGPNLATYELTDRISRRWQNAAVAWKNESVEKISKTLIQLSQDTLNFETGETSVARLERLDRLAAALAQYDATPDAELLKRIETEYGEMKRHGQSAALCKALSQRFSHANLVVRVNPKRLAQRPIEAVHRSFPIQSTYGGTRVSGNGNFDGQVKVTVPYDADRVRAHVELSGTSVAKTRGSQSGVTVSATGITNASSSRDLVFTDFGPPRLLATVANASTSIRFDNISVNLPRRFRSTATSRVHASKAESERRAAEEARAWLKTELETNTRSLVDNEMFQQVYDFRDRLFADDLCQPQVHSGVYPGYLDWRVWHAPYDQFASITEVLSTPVSGEMQVAIHASFLTYLAETEVGGKRITEGDSLDLFGGFRNTISGQVPQTNESVKELSSPSDAKSKSILFSKERPIRWSIDDNIVRVDLHLDRIEADGDTFENYVATMNYQIKFLPGGASLVVDEKVNVLPADYDPKLGKLGARKLSVCRLIERQLQPLIATDIVLPKMAVPTNTPGVKEVLPLVSVQSHKGWLELVYGKR